ERRRIRALLATDCGGGQPQLAALLRSGQMGLHGERLVLAFRLFLGVGAVSLWALVSARETRVVLDAGRRLGAFLGHLALYGPVLRVGAVATPRPFQTRSRPHGGRAPRATQLRLWRQAGRLYLCAGEQTS